MNLKKIYDRWNSALLDNERYYRKSVTKYLDGIKGKEILTSADYLVISPEGGNGPGMLRRLYSGNWLQIKGDIKSDTVSKYFYKDNSTPLKWEGSKTPLSVFGKITGYRLEKNESGEVIILYLEGITLKEDGKSDDAGKNNK